MAHMRRGPPEDQLLDRRGIGGRLERPGGNAEDDAIFQGLDDVRVELETRSLSHGESSFIGF
jgi:hypothetical protein